MESDGVHCAGGVLYIQVTSPPILRPYRVVATFVHSVLAGVVAKSKKELPRVC